MKSFSMAALIGALLCSAVRGDLQAAPRAIPRPSAGHPGNIFLAGESVSVPLPAGEADAWVLTDYEGRTVAQGPAKDGRAELGKLPVGYYELARGASPAPRVSLGVLQPLRTPTPLTSPLGIDVAMAWFYPPQQMAAAAGLCALAGMNHVRDRLSWAELEPKRGEFATTNRYDSSAQAQAEAGLQVLQVGHRSPAWANPDGRRFPLDLRDIYNFHRAMVQRWRGQVTAFEPWNEADIQVFGGQLGSEMASLQKAAYLGIKAGNPKATACLNVLALHRAATLQDLNDNEAWPYFDTFNLHHYEPFTNYPKLYADFRAISAGRPLWISECSVPVKWQDEQLKEPSPADLRLQGERIAMTYAMTIHEGAQAVFYFLLPHYVEGQTQFGIVRPDLTPRPAFLALAAAGRLLADARPLGHLRADDPKVHGYLFDARPDGRRARVLVVWADQETAFELPAAPRTIFDHLGRSVMVSGRQVHLSRAPQFVLFGRDPRLPLDPPPVPAKWLAGKPSPVVLQAVLPESKVLLEKSAYKTTPGELVAVPICVYNFSEQPLHGRLTASAPADSTASAGAERPRIELAPDVTVGPGERKELKLQLTLPASKGGKPVVIRITGDFGSGGQPVLSLRFLSAQGVAAGNNHG